MQPVAEMAADWKGGKYLKEGNVQAAAGTVRDAHSGGVSSSARPAAGDVQAAMLVFHAAMKELDTVRSVWLRRRQGLGRRLAGHSGTLARGAAEGLPAIASSPATEDESDGYLDAELVWLSQSCAGCREGHHVREVLAGNWGWGSRCFW